MRQRIITLLALLLVANCTTTEELTAQASACVNVQVISPAGIAADKTVAEKTHCWEPVNRRMDAIARRDRERAEDEYIRNMCSGGQVPVCDVFMGRRIRCTCVRRW